MVFALATGVYLHTAYAQASDGSVGFRTDSAEDAAYLGQYTDGSATDATDPSRYTWTPIDLGEGAELTAEDETETDDGTDALIDLLSRDLYDTGQFAPDTQATGDRKAQTYFQPEAPDPEEFVFGVGDLWQDTDDGNHLYRWDGTAWVDAQDGGIPAAAELAQAADEKAQAADTKATAADEKAQAAGTTAQAVQEVLNGLTVVDANGVTKISGGRIDTDSLFAQDITATGTITGVTLNGAKLTGQGIDITATIGDSKFGIVSAVVQASTLLSLYASGGTTKSQILLTRGGLTLTGQTLLSLNTQELAINADTITDEHYSKTSYTSFSGGVISSGTINVVKYLGWCQVFGEFKLSAAVSDWTEVLTAAQVPAPRHGTNAYIPSTTWGSSFVRAPRIQINGNGGLRVRYGAAATYNFDTSYPI